MSKSKVPPVESRKPVWYRLNKLQLDSKNPRFGFPSSDSADQSDVLDQIVEKFGVDDILSSLAVNGYFEAEPLVCRQIGESDSAVVVEGNRRLAACLMLIGDKRALRQTTRAEQYQRLWKEHGSKSVDPVPVILFGENEQKRELLSYLGVRHIVSAQPWDSYAKAAWVARVIEDSSFKVQDVAVMIGDQHRTVARLLQGYYFIKQLVETGQFRPEDSVRRGRGSVTEYPFSWVYTLLGYSATRSYLSLGDDVGQKNPIAPKDLPKAALIATSMFGDRSKGRNAAISDSRELGELASALADPEKISLLEQGKTLAEIIQITKPIDTRLRQGLAGVREIQSDLISGLTEQPVSAKVAAPLVDLANKNRRTAAEIERKLKDAASDSKADESDD